MRYKPDPEEDEQLKQDTFEALEDVFSELLEPQCGPDDVIGLLEVALTVARKWRDAR